jgi:hypothetical protein
VQLRVHHFGLVVGNIEQALAQSLWTARGEAVVDPIQQCRLCLATLAGTDHPIVELVEPLYERAPTWATLKRGGGWHHLCVAVESTEVGDALMKDRRMLPVSDWQPAVLFGGRPVRFAYTRNRELLEFLAGEPT